MLSTMASSAPKQKQNPLQLVYATSTVKRPLTLPVCSDRHAFAVCGTDGNTYRDDCARAANGVHTACPMPCPCVFNNTAWIKACPGVLPYDPVCSSRGVSFAHPCRARAAGADVQCRGACPCSPPSMATLVLVVAVGLVVVLGLWRW